MNTKFCCHLAMPDLNSVCDPPLADSYQTLLSKQENLNQCEHGQSYAVVREWELPLIDVGGLRSCNMKDKQICIEAITRASSEWGFFQVVNHGISSDLLSRMSMEQIKLFSLPFEKKISSKLLNNSYIWGTPTATSVRQLSWSEAFHVPFSKISEDTCPYGEFNSLREAMQKLAEAMCELARTLAGVLAENLGHDKRAFPEGCSRSTCFLRLNHYPPCPFSAETFGLVSHTDSDFLTILHQDHVGGLQLMKDSKWVAVQPNPDALIVNIGDLFQAWSNGIYKSVEHKVIANKEMDRYSIAYFLCPSHESVIGSCKEPSLYREFTFGEFRKQVQEDVQQIGHKVGLPRFLL